MKTAAELNLIATNCPPKYSTMDSGMAGIQNRVNYYIEELIPYILNRSANNAKTSVQIYMDEWDDELTARFVCQHLYELGYRVTYSKPGSQYLVEIEYGLEV